ncbi:MAG: bacteriophage abortive infection AbiH family protein [Arcobacteraceae bacterium]|nr:bacteriophage abortive infection AbiH family protein [Arcobacteraceae bacterium]
MAKKNQTLYIIGNGFDLHHKIKSSYWHFQEYIKKVDSSLHTLVEDYLQIEENWSDFEEALASIDIDTLTEYASDFLVSYGAENWSDAYHHDYQYEVEEVTRKLSFKLKKYFKEWLTLLNIPKKNKIKKKLLSLDKSGKYLTFNYTNILRKTYNINKVNILHIHGSLQKSEQIVLGHNWSPNSKNYLGEQRDPEDIDTRVLEGNEIIERYFRSTFKPTKKIIKNNRSFFSKLRNIDKIIILGHSLSHVDLLYFKAINKSINKNRVKWVVSYHSENDIINHSRQLQSLEISKKAIKFVKLKEILKTKQKRG